MIFVINRYIINAKKVSGMILLNYSILKEIVLCEGKLPVTRYRLQVTSFRLQGIPQACFPFH